MTLDDKIRSILRSPAGQGYYRARPKGAARTAAPTPHRRTGQPAKRLATAKKSGPKRGTWGEALLLHRRLLFRLRKYGKASPERALLKTLRGCRKSKRCTSAACPKCNYAVQGLMNELHLDLREGGILFDACITCIPALLIPAPRNEPVDEADHGGEQAAAKVEKLHRRLDDAFDLSGATTLLGAIDFNYHEFPQGGFKAHGRPHFHGLGFGKQLAAGDKPLRGEFPAKGSINTPVVVAPFDGADNWVRYMFKIPNSRMIRRKDGKGNWARSDYKALTVKQQLQQAQVLHGIGWSGRLYLRGLDLIEGRQGWRLVLTDFKPEVLGNKRRRGR